MRFVFILPVGLLFLIDPLFRVSSQVQKQKPRRHTLAAGFLESYELRYNPTATLLNSRMFPGSRFKQFIGSSLSVSKKKVKQKILRWARWQRNAALEFR
jgi:hypothetical protein